MLFMAAILAIVLAVSVHVASYGLYVLKQEKNRRGAAGALITSAATLLAPLLLMWYYVYFT